MERELKIKKFRKKPIQCVETKKIYMSARQAERDTGIDHRKILDCCHNRKEYAGGYRWQFFSVSFARDPNTIYVLSLSYGKDSIACLEAIKLLGLPLDRIVHAEVWATDTIPADLPPMVEFKKKADKIIKKRYGIEVEHVWATKKVADGGGVLSYDSVFRTTTNTKEYGEHIYGFPKRNGAWCVGQLKQNLLTETNLRRYVLSTAQTSWGGVRTSYGFPMRRGQWCNNMLKVNALNNIRIPIRKLHGRLVQRTQENSNQEYTDTPETSKWGDRNGVRDSNEIQSKQFFLQARKRRAV